MREESVMDWHDAQDIGIEGKGWPDTVHPFDRIPRKAEGVVRLAIWSMKRSSTGMCLRFRTDTKKIHARWKLGDKALDEQNFNRCADSGLDLYGDDGGRWRWVAATKCFDSQTPEVCIVEGLDGKLRDYLLYLPLRNHLLQLEVGVPADAEFTALPPRKDPPIVAYGTSIVHGAYASRPGMVYPSILGRRLQRPVINLGFSGNAHMEIELADLLGELDAAVYLIDAMPNMDLELVEKNAAAFLVRLKERRPATPIVMVGDFQRTNNWILPDARRTLGQKIRRCREIVEGLIRDGMAGMHYVDGEAILGEDGEASIDGIHPGDVGFLRVADCLDPVLRQILR